MAVKKAKHLTGSEEDLMEMFWERNEPLTSEWELCTYHAALAVEERHDKGMRNGAVRHAVRKAVYPCGHQRTVCGQACDVQRNRGQFHCGGDGGNGQ